MQKRLVLLLVLPLLLFSLVSYAAGSNRNERQVQDDTQRDIRNLQHEIKQTNDDVAILRRDQVNYRLDKDLLKEAYASNLQSINIIVAIVFGVITLLGGVLGYFGVKSIRELRTDYAKELDQLKTVKIGLEAELASFRQKQIAVESRVGDLTKTNEEQDRRLKVLELTEKVNELAQARQFAWALEYCSIGLGLDPNNIRLLSLKSACHGGLREFSAAIESNKKILELEPGNNGIAFNLLEYLALTNSPEEFESIYTKYKVPIGAERDGALAIYLRALLALVMGDLDGAKALLAPYVSKCPDGAAPRMNPWQFEEALHVISQMPTGALKEFALKLIQFYRGNIPTQELKAMLV